MSDKKSTLDLGPAARDQEDITTIKNICITKLNIDSFNKFSIAKGVSLSISAMIQLHTLKPIDCSNELVRKQRYIT